MVVVAQTIYTRSFFAIKELPATLYEYYHNNYSLFINRSDNHFAIKETPTETAHHSFYPTLPQPHEGPSFASQYYHHP
jgi:hypothetical protein